MVRRPGLGMAAVIAASAVLPLAARAAPSAPAACEALVGATLSTGRVEHAELVSAGPFQPPEGPAGHCQTKPARHPISRFVRSRASYLRCPVDAFSPRFSWKSDGCCPKTEAAAGRSQPLSVWSDNALSPVLRRKRSTRLPQALSATAGLPWGLERRGIV